MVFASEFVAIGWVSARVLAPAGDGTLAASTQARSHMIWSCSRSRRRIVSWIRGQTPASISFVKATPACHPTAAAEFVRQVLPRYASLENKQDSSQGRAIIDARAAAFRRWAMGRKMSCYKRPQVFGKKCAGHGKHSVYKPGRHVNALTEPAHVRYRP